jgi:hypothetical protein
MKAAQALTSALEMAVNHGGDGIVEGDSKERRGGDDGLRSAQAQGR